MLAVVTGAAGFIGSTLVERLLADGATVVGVDAFTPYYPSERKRANLAGVAGDAHFSLVEADLREADLSDLVGSADTVFHLAGQPGVRLSWDAGFTDYVGHNVLATQRLLEAARRTDLRRLVYASSSSVYGQAGRHPSTETDLPRPHSPYGVTKLGGEHLCGLYAANYGVPAVSLRYFTVYGPRQRPDMAVHRLIECGLEGRPFPLFGTGEQQREFTYVGDVVAATVAAAAAPLVPGEVLNVAGGSSVSVRHLIELVGSLLGRELPVEVHDEQAGDVAHTGASVQRAQEQLGWEAAVALEDGLAAQVAWHRDLRPVDAR